MRDEEQDVADAGRVVAGDVSAFEGIVERWQGRLVNLAWRFCRDHATAEDMAQEVFVRVFRGLSSFRGQSAFSTWVTSVAVNTFRSRLRAEGPPAASLDPDRTVNPEASLHARLEQRQRDEAVRRAVLALPEHYREAVVLFYFEDKDLAETARVLGLAEGTLKARLHRARELLRRKCTEET